MADLGELIARIGLDTSDLKKGVAESEGLLSGGLATAATVAAAAIAAIGAAAIGFGIAAAHKFEDVGMEVIGLQRVAGGTVEEMSRLRFAAVETGVGVDVLGNSIRILSGHLVKNDQAAQDMGIAYRDANGAMLPTNEILLRLADRFASMPNGIEKTRLATELFGRAGTAMIPILNKGRDGLAELEAEATKFGLVLSTDNIDAIRANIAAHREWHAAWEGLQVQLGAVILPLLTKLAEFMTNVLVPGIGMAADFARNVLAPALASLSDAIQRVATSGKAAWDLFMLGFSDPRASDGLTGLSNVIFEFGQGAKLAFDAAVSGLTGAQGKFVTFGDTVLHIFETVGPAVVVALGGIVSFITDSLIPGIQTAIRGIQGPLGDFVRYISDTAPQVQEAIGHIINVIKAQLALIGGLFAAVFIALSAAWSQWGDDVVRIVRIVFDTIKAYVDTAIRVIRDIINGVLALINGDWGKAWAAFSDIPKAAFDLIKTLVGNAMKVIGDLFATGWNAISQAVPAAFGVMLDFFKALPARIIGAMGSVTSALVGAGHDLITGFYNGVFEKAGQLFDFFRNLPSTIEGLIGSALTWLKQDGIDTLQGFINGLIEKVKDVTKWIVTELPKKIADGTTSAVDWLKDAAPKIIDGLIKAMKAVMSDPTTVAKIVGAIVGGLALVALALPLAAGILGGAIVLGIIEGIAQEIGKLTKWIATELPGALQSAASGAGSWLVSAGSSVMTGLWDGLRTGLSTIIGWASGFGSTIAGWFSGAVSWLFNAGVDVLTGLWNGLRTGFQTVINWAGGFFSTMGGWFVGAASWLYNAGIDVITGLLNGMIKALDFLPSIVQKFLGIDVIIKGLRTAVDQLNGAKIDIQAHAETTQAQQALDDLLATMGGIVDYSHPPPPGTPPAFATGGLTHGPSLAGEKGQELVLPLNDLQRARQLLREQGGAITGASGGSAGSMQSSVTNYNLYGPIMAADPAELQRQLEAKARVAAMAGR